MPLKHLSSPLDLQDYTLEELLEINKRVVDRIKYLRARTRLEKSQSFQMGDRISFIDPNTIKQEAFVVSVKRNRVHAITVGNKQSWNLSPTLITLEQKKCTETMKEFFTIFEEPLKKILKLKKF